VAMLWMAAFHFTFDLNVFGLIKPRQLFTLDPLWTTQRTCILSLFLFCAGLSMAVALHSGQSWPRFWRRWAQVAGCALLVSLGSAWMFPRSWIFFGVLHGLAVMLILARLAAPLKGWLWLLGAAALCVPQFLKLPLFDAPALNWIGLVTKKPVTEDYVPLLPWIGVLLWGLAAGQWLLQHRAAWFAGAVPARLQPLAVLGRWSLSFYMLHQPVFIGALMGGRQLGWW
jgi:uncharacterized membrane protein